LWAGYSIDSQLEYPFPSDITPFTYPVPGQNITEIANVTTTSSFKDPLNYTAVLLATSLPAIIIGRAAVAVLLIVALLVAIFSANRKSIIQKSTSAMYAPITAAVFVVSVIWGLGLLTSVDVWHSLTTEARTILYVSLMVPLWSVLVGDETKFELCLKTLVISSAVLGLVAVIALFMPSPFIGTIRGNPGTPLEPIRILKESASSASLIVPLLLWFAWHHGGRWRLAAGFAVLVMVAIVFLTQSRSALAGLIGAAVVTILLYNFHRRNLMILLVSGLGGILILGFAIDWLYTTRSWSVGAYGGGPWPLPEWLIDPPRQAIWTFAWNAGEPHRWLGVGINVIDKLPGARDWNLLTGTRNIPLHPHNWVVEIVIETGIVGLVGLLSILTLFASKHICRYLRSGSPALLALAGVWGAYWISGLFSFSYWSSWWQVSFLAATAICLAGDALRQSPR